MVRPDIHPGYYVQSPLFAYIMTPLWGFPSETGIDKKARSVASWSRHTPGEVGPHTSTQIDNIFVSND